MQTASRYLVTPMQLLGRKELGMQPNKRKRRSPGEGSIRQLPDGRWRARATLGGKARDFYARTSIEAISKRDQAVQDYRNGLPVPDQRLTTQVFLENWLRDIKGSVRPTTYRSYEQLLRIHVIPNIGKVPLAKLTKARIQNLLNAKNDEMAASSVQKIRVVLKSALSAAVADRLVVSNVVLKTKPPKPDDLDITPLTPSQTQLFLKAAKSNRLFSLFALAVATGMRQGELLGLRWSDVNLDAAKLTVRKSLSRGELVKPKTAASRRTLRLPPETVCALREQRRRQATEQLLAGPVWDGNRLDLVFTTSIGTPMNGANLRRSLHRQLKAAGLPRVRFHDLRHGFATYLLSMGRPIHEVSRLLGHSSPEITLRYYGHLLPEMEQATVEAMSSLLKAAS
jgi:integrase